MTLADPATLQSLLDRMRRLRAESQPRWGRMNVQEMVCHVKEAYRPREAGDVSTPFSRSIIRWVALHTPLQWPKGVKTVREMDQKINPTAGPSFDLDLAGLLTACSDFAGRPQSRRHAIFGALSENEWKIWGWRHADHHLRQFGV